VRRGDVVGYRGVAIDVDGHIVMVGCGSANGVSTLSDGRSPFHFDRRRLPLIEAPHMHTSMVLVDDGGSVPRIGDLVDVQRPLINTTVDHVDWH
jgi:alanine racemase